MSGGLSWSFARVFALCSLSILFCLTLFSGILGIIDQVLFYIVVMVALIIGTYVYGRMHGRTFLRAFDDDYSWVFGILCLLFSVTLAVTLAGVPLQNNPYIGLDKLLHAFAGAAIAAIGVLFFRKRIPNPLVLAIFVLCFAVAIGAMWEVFEWLMDALPAQYRHVSSGYTDTIFDMVADALGALAVALAQLRRR